MTPWQSKLERQHSLLKSTGTRVDHQATGSARADPKGIIIKTRRFESNSHTTLGDGPTKKPGQITLHIQNLLATQLDP